MGARTRLPESAWAALHGRCGAKGQVFFGWRLHLVFSLDGIPLRFDLLPARCHDLTPIYQLLTDLPPAARVLGDKGYNSRLDEACLRDQFGVRLLPMRRRNMQPHRWADPFDLRQFSFLTSNHRVYTNEVNSLDWNPDGTSLASGNLDGTVRIWDTTTWQTIKLIQSPNAVYAVAWSPEATLQLLIPLLEILVVCAAKTTTTAT